MQIVESYSHLGPYCIFWFKEIKILRYHFLLQVTAVVTVCSQKYSAYSQCSKYENTQLVYTFIIKTKKTHHTNKKIKQLVNHKESWNLGCPQELYLNLV